jgi:hypothetical protein
MSVNFGRNGFIKSSPAVRQRNGVGRARGGPADHPELDQRAARACPREALKRISLVSGDPML